MPERELVMKIVAVPSAVNMEGDIFGGWIVSQMDLATYLHARKLTNARLVTKAIEKLVFHKPVYVGDLVMCYTSTERLGTTSITVHIELFVERMRGGATELVTEGSFIFVAIGPDRQSIPWKTT